MMLHNKSYLQIELESLQVQYSVVLVCSQCISDITHINNIIT